MLLKQEQNFWIVTVHAPRPTIGNPNADFKNTWLKVVSTVPDFKNSLPGYDPYSMSNKLLGYPGRYYDANSDSGKMYARLYTLETGKAVVPVVVLTPNRQVLDALNHIVEAVVGSVRVAPLKASPIRNTLTMADLAGEWHTGMASGKTYFDRYTGNYVGTSTTAYSRSLSDRRQRRLYLRNGRRVERSAGAGQGHRRGGVGRRIHHLEGTQSHAALPLRESADGDRRFHGDDPPAGPGGSGEGQCHNAPGTMGPRAEEMMTS
jgi:hypothetical protein